MWERLTGEVLGQLTPPGGVILVLPQSLAGAWLCSQLGHSGGRREPTPKPQAETGDRPREIGSWDCANDIREELPQPLGVGGGLPGCGLRSVSEGGTSAVTGSAGAPVRVAGSCLCGN